MFIHFECFLVNRKDLSHKQRDLSALHQTNIVGCEDLLIHSQSGIAPGWSGAGGVVGVGAGGLFGNWPRMGRRKKAQHYVIVFLCLKRLLHVIIARSQKKNNTKSGLK